MARGPRAGLEDGAGALPAHDREPDAYGLQLGAQRQAVPREADHAGRLQGQPPAAQSLPGARPPLERAGDRAARRTASRPRTPNLAGTERRSGSAREIPEG